MKPILLVIACIVLLILVIYNNKDKQNYKTKQTQAESPHSKIMKDSYEFLPNEARMCDLIY
jgi:ABC-type cobalt transport system substrate-binding protein